ncbi:hypothetical protein P4H39_30550 [Paenibacillus lautus]|uniref:hypothetical protein n=1 Tax=Paenibacillus lautus TaxID=1401 RepID=UPI002DB7B0C4|nr:hypothetical protein [Paenibacillus lautus]MEC0206956.1 hypothetical protein [Paenibacillus lautus]
MSKPFFNWKRASIKIFKQNKDSYPTGKSSYENAGVSVETAGAEAILHYGFFT